MLYLLESKEPWVRYIIKAFWRTPIEHIRVTRILALRRKGWLQLRPAKHRNIPSIWTLLYVIVPITTHGKTDYFTLYFTRTYLSLLWEPSVISSLDSVWPVGKWHIHHDCNRTYLPIVPKLVQIGPQPSLLLLYSSLCHYSAYLFHIPALLSAYLPYAVIHLINHGLACTEQFCNDLNILHYS